MAQSLAQLYVHIIFSTKHRAPCIEPEVRRDLYGYMAGTLEKLNCHAKEIGGTADHVHVLCSISKNMSLADLVEKLKAASSRWVKTKSPSLQDFRWQSGYAGFSVSRSGLGRVAQYIARQEEHHRRVSFQDELRQFLAKHGVEFDEKFLWD